MSSKTSIPNPYYGSMEELDSHILFPSFGCYILEGTVPVPCESISRWSEWMSGPDRFLLKTEVGGDKVSTVFPGINHGGTEGRPILFEPLVFGPTDTAAEGTMERYTTYEEAVAGHNRMGAALTLACALERVQKKPNIITPKPVKRKRKIEDV